MTYLDALLFIGSALVVGGMLLAMLVTGYREWERTHQ